MVGASHRCANPQNADAPSPNLTINTLPEMLRHRSSGNNAGPRNGGPVKLFELAHAEEAISKTLVK